MRRIVLAAGLVVATSLLLGTPRPARATVDECRQACRDTEDTCLFDVHERAKLCEEGCADERETYRSACLVDPVPDEAACTAARDALRACLNDCGDAARSDQVTCTRNREDCVAANCEPIQRPGFGRYFRGPRGRFHR